jgi:hypothetical protein
MALTIVRALQAEDLFGPWFRANEQYGDSWKNWRVFLKALYALRMDAEDLAIYREHTGRTSPPKKAFREAYAQVGRRGGKSMISALVGIYQSCFVNWEASLYPGERPLCMLLAADKRQAEQILDYVRGFFAQIPLLKAMIQSQKEGTIRLQNGVRLEVHTSSYRSVRGYTVCACIADEVAFWRDADSRNPAAEVLSAIRPSLLTVPGSLLLCISSPYSKRGPLWEASKKYFANDVGRALYWRGSTLEMNPSAPTEEIAEAYADDAASASAEYGGLFREDLESIFSTELVESCIERGTHERPYVGQTRYRGFVDPSGGRSDSFTLAIAHEEGGKAILDLLREVPAPFSPEVVTMEFCEVLRSYGLRECCGDSYAAEFSAEQFAKNGIRYVPSDKNRSELYLELLPAMASGRAVLLDSKRLVGQLTALERRTGKNADSIDHPAGMHDDLANAAAGAITLALPKTAGRLQLSLLEMTGRLSWVPGEPVSIVLSNPPGQPPPPPPPPAPPPPAAVVPPCACGVSLWVVRGPMRHCNNCGVNVFIEPPNGSATGGRWEYSVRRN